MRILKVYTNDIANGPGIRVSVWCSGCTKQCPECHNRETWDESKGTKLSPELINKILDACGKPEIQGLTITGGDPLEKFNLQGTIQLCKAFKKTFPNKDIWLWTGENISSVQIVLFWRELFSYINVVVDGRYIHKLKDVTLPYSGSSNQHVIDVKQSYIKGKIICLDTLESAKIILMKKEKPV